MTAPRKTLQSGESPVTSIAFSQMHCVLRLITRIGEDSQIVITV